MTAPLTSLKILDFSTLLPGPFASMVLADLGADILRIEAPHRPDIVRMMPAFGQENSAWHSLLNRSKRSLALDLKKQGAAQIVKDLVPQYDIVLEQFRPGVMDRLGIGYEILSQINPQLIYCALTGYGQTGPYKDRAGHDNNYLALAGVMHHTGRQASGPLPLGVQVADIGGGSYGAITGILAAVIHRQQTGEGQFVDVSMFDGALAWNAPVASHYLVGGQDQAWESMSLNGGSFYGFYRTADGRYLSVGSLEPKFWTGFCQAIDRPDLVEAGLNLHDLARQQQLKTEIQDTIAQRPFAEWVSIFAELDVCVEPVLNHAEMVEHPQTQARQMIVEVPTNKGATQPQIGNPLKFSKAEPTYKHTGATLGQHTAEILAEMAYSPEKIAGLRANEVFG